MAGRMTTTGILIKTPAQIEGIRGACRLTAQALDMVAGRVGPGISTDTVNGWVHEYTLDHGARPAPLGYRGYPKSVCTSVNNVILHGIPDDKTILRDGDIINVDVTCLLDGYFGDASRMFCIGEVGPDARKLVDVTRECLYLGIGQVRPGNTVGHIGHAVERHARAHGYSVVRDFVGHGVGVRFHEPPDILHFGRKGRGAVLRENMVFTIEPMINAGGDACVTLDDGWTTVTADGTLSAQWEHTVMVTRSGVEILTGGGLEPPPPFS
jgi:methionyl aminopeptidase